MGERGPYKAVIQVQFLIGLPLEKKVNEMYDVFFAFIIVVIVMFIGGIIGNMKWFNKLMDYIAELVVK